MRTFSVDMIPGGSQTAIACNQFERGDVWVFALYYNGGRFQIPAGATVAINGTKNDKAAFEVSASVADNTVIVTVTEQMTAAAGKCVAELMVVDGSTVLYTANFYLLIEPAAVQGDTVPSEIPSAIVDKDGNVYYSAESKGGGISPAATAMLIDILRSAVYSADKSNVIDALEEELNNGDPVIPVTGVSLDTASKAISVNESSVLTATVSPANASNKAVTWASSDSSVATVTASGHITGVSTGTATITVTTIDGQFTASCDVVVSVQNLIDTSASTPGVYINRDNGTTPSSDTWTATDYIWLEPNTTYYSEGCFLDNFYAFYNASKTYVTSPPSEIAITMESDRNWGAKRKGTITTGATGYYFRGSYNTAIQYTPYIALAPIE